MTLTERAAWLRRHGYPNGISRISRKLAAEYPHAERHQILAALDVHAITAQPPLWTDSPRVRSCIARCDPRPNQQTLLWKRDLPPVLTGQKKRRRK